MVLTHPDFTVVRPPGLAKEITDAEWWLWERLHELEPTTELGGILAWKSGFHSTGQYNLDNHPGNYSIRDQPNKTGPWWKTHTSALDWTFPEAWGGDYGRISKYTSRVINSGKDPNDPRLDLVLYEVFGQGDWDQSVEGWNEYRDESASSDPSHLGHMHFSLLRMACGDFWAMWALLTVLMGWTVAQWRASLNTTAAEEVASTNEEEEDAVVITHVHAKAKDGKPLRFGLGIVSGGKLIWLETPDQAAANARASATKLDAKEVSQAEFDRERANFTAAVPA